MQVQRLKTNDGPSEKFTIDALTNENNTDIVRPSSPDEEFDEWYQSDLIWPGNKTQMKVDTEACY